MTFEKKMFVSTQVGLPLTLSLYYKLEDKNLNKCLYQLNFETSMNMIDESLCRRYFRCLIMFFLPMSIFLSFLFFFAFRED